MVPAAIQICLTAVVASDAKCNGTCLALPSPKPPSTISSLCLHVILKRKHGLTKEGNNLKKKIISCHHAKDKFSGKI